MNSLLIESRLEQRLRTKILKFCNICGDEATSKHFSAMSCDACAAFFRRTISGKKSYRCLYKQDCALYNITPRRMCKFCRFQKCRKAGMNPEEVRSGSNTPINSPPPPKSSSTPIQASIPSTSKTPNNSLSIFPSTPSSMNDATPFLKAFHRALVLENSIFVALKNPVLLSAYFQPPHDSAILEIALKNFHKVTDKFATINNFFMFQYIESAGVILETKMIEKFPAVHQLINQSFQQYAELIKIRVRNEFEFAALCQLTLLINTREEFPHFQSILAQNFEIIAQNFNEYYANENGENPNSSLSHVSDLANTIHLIRKTYRSQIASLLRTTC